MMDKISILFASDNNYIPFLCVAIQSVLDNSSAVNEYEIILLSDNISEIKKEVILSTYNTDNVSLKIIEISNILNEHNFSFRCEQLTRSAFSRLFLPELLPDYKKVLYMDCDIIAKTDVSDLFNTNIDDVLVAVIKDRYVDIKRHIDSDVYNHVKNNVGLDDTEDYFNSGIVLLNLEKFRQIYTVDYMVKIAASRIWMWEDQDVLNKLCKGNVLWLPAKWNVLWGLDIFVREKMFMQKDYLEAFKCPSIVHYAGGCIPTKAFEDYFSVDFWRIARITPYYESLLASYTKNKVYNELESFKSHIETIASSTSALVYNELENCRRQIGSKKKNRVKKIIKKLIGKLFKHTISQIEVEEKQNNDNLMALLQEIKCQIGENNE